MRETKDSSQIKWSIDQAHSKIGFNVKHLMISDVKGSFTGFGVSIYTHANDLATAEIDLRIDASTLDTGDAKRDKHLKSADFFDIEKHKQITFTSSTISKPDADGNRELCGELTMMGITRNIKLNVQFGAIVRNPFGIDRAYFTVNGKINRTDWQLKWNPILEPGGLLVGEEINILCEFEIIRPRGKDLILELDSTVLEKIVLYSN